MAPVWTMPERHDGTGVGRSMAVAQRLGGRLTLFQHTHLDVAWTTR